MLVRCRVLISTGIEGAFRRTGEILVLDREYAERRARTGALEILCEAPELETAATEPAGETPEPERPRARARRAGARG